VATHQKTCKVVSASRNWSDEVASLREEVKCIRTDFLEEIKSIRTDISDLRADLKVGFALLRKSMSEETTERKEEKEESKDEKKSTVNIIHNVVQNITIYGKEELPKAYKDMQVLCKNAQFTLCTPRYVQMKHFSVPGQGNVRISEDDNSMQVYIEKPTGEMGWSNVDKTRELVSITVKELNEIVERYGNMPVTYMFKKWVDNHNVKDITSNEFEDIMKRVEETIINHSR